MTKQLLVIAFACAACGKSNEAPATTDPPKQATTTKTVELAKIHTDEPPVAPSAKLVERGAYLVKLAGCVACHTPLGPKGPDLERAFAGGLEMPDPIGTWRTPNITQDKSSGIGNWTDDQIAAAIRDGVRPDGTGLFAIMPFANYARISNDDIKAIVAFLRTVKPVTNIVAPNKDLKLPKGPDPHGDDAKQARASGDGTSEDQVKRGGYLTSLMLCAHCHFTPGKDFAPAGPDKMFSGGLPMELPMLGKGTLFARNITSDPDTGIGKWSVEQIAASIKTLAKPDGALIRGPMLFLQPGWSQIDDGDLRAVAAFIKQLPPINNKVPPATFQPNAPPAPK
jgi:mono/diheme cytochrome c family protein